MAKYFVDAPPTRAILVTDDKPFENVGYIVEAEDAGAAVYLIRAYRNGELWALQREIEITVVDPFRRMFSKEERVAAAAPELLAALQAIVSRLKNQRAVGNNDLLRLKSIEIGEAAIAKAEGTQS